MPRVTTEQAMKITNPTSNGYFSLKNDGDKAQVRFLYNSAADIETYAVHEVSVNGFNKHVDCLKDAEGNGTCPFCEKGIKLTARTFFKLCRIDADAAEIWDCGLRRAPSIENNLQIASSDKPLVSIVFEITRHGKANSTDTFYDVKVVKKDDITLDDLPTAPDVYGKYVWKKSAEEMEHFITHNEFPKIGGQPRQGSNQAKPRVNRNVF